MENCQTPRNKKWPLYLAFRCSNRGFTLIELLVVFIIVGILAALSLPVLLDQIGRARETEAKSQLGAISRAQQAYHFEQQQFADSLGKLNLTGGFSAVYYDYAEPMGEQLSLRVEQQATARNSGTARTRNYASGIYFNDGLYQVVLCQGNFIGSEVSAPDAADGDCTNGEQIE